jgi:hypothetical protein
MSGIRLRTDWSTKPPKRYYVVIGGRVTDSDGDGDIDEDDFEKPEGIHGWRPGPRSQLCVPCPQGSRTTDGVTCRNVTSGNSTGGTTKPLSEQLTGPAELITDSDAMAVRIHPLPGGGQLLPSISSSSSSSSDSSSSTTEVEDPVLSASEWNSDIAVAVAVVPFALHSQQDAAAAAAVAAPP